jgi:membrane-bound serine protease (ClpP class)
MKKTILLLAVFLAVLPAWASKDSKKGAKKSQPTPVAAQAMARPAGPVVVLSYKGMIGPVSLRYLRQGLAVAKEKHAQCLVLELDTPGGMMDPMRDMIQDMLSAPYPVVVYISPQGARAASAGTFLAMASDLVAMAPNTNLGAAHPVYLSGEKASDKVTNDAVAYIMTLAENRGRNKEWAEKAVRQSVALGEQEALKQKVVDMVAADEKELLQFLDGRQVEKDNETYVLRTKAAEVIAVELTLRDRFLMFLGDPTLAYILFLIGLFGLIYEVTHPGLAAPGIMGGLCLLMALISFGTLPVNWGGVALIVLGVGLFVAEAFTFSHGALAVGGAVALVMGSLILYESPMPGYTVKVSLWVIFITVALTAGFFIFILKEAVKAQRLPALQSHDHLKGMTGKVITALDPEGMVHVDGEDWSAYTEEGSIGAREEVVVEEIKGLRLKVKKVKS